MCDRAWLPKPKTQLNWSQEEGLQGHNRVQRASLIQPSCYWDELISVISRHRSQKLLRSTDRPVLVHILTSGATPVWSFSQTLSAWALCLQLQSKQSSRHQRCPDASISDDVTSSSFDMTHDTIRNMGRQPNKSPLKTRTSRPIAIGARCLAGLWFCRTSTASESLLQANRD